MHGDAETFTKDCFETIVSKEKVVGIVSIPLEDEDESIEVPVLEGYRKPYDSMIEDEFGMEHYIYYEEDPEFRLGIMKKLANEINLIKELLSKLSTTYAPIQMFQIDLLRNSLQRLSLFAEEYDEIFNSEINNYPFIYSFDELVCEVKDKKDNELIAYLHSVTDSAIELWTVDQEIGVPASEKEQVIRTFQSLGYKYVETEDKTISHFHKEVNRNLLVFSYEEAELIFKGIKR